MRTPTLGGAALLSLVTLAVPGCPAPEPVPETPGWSVLLDENTLPGAVLSVWGAAPGDVFIAGGPLGNSGSEALAMHYDGNEWKDLAAGGAETFWWVSGSSATDVWFVGEKGRIAHYDGISMKDLARPVTSTIWGVFAFAPDDAWAVSGTPDAGVDAPNDIVLHWNGAAWEAEVLPGAPLGVSLFKVWGTSSDDLFVVGEHGTLWHRTKGGWVFEGGDPLLVQSRLFTVNGCASDDVYAVGAQSVLHRDASGWSKVDVELGNVVNGVACGPSGNALLVGNGGLKERLDNGVWIDDFASEPYPDLHGSWADGEGRFWAVGGDFQSPPKKDQRRKGVVGRFVPEPAAP